MIEIANLSKHFGGIRAVDGVNLTIEQGSITGLVGPNGAGKSVLFNLIAGLYPPTQGNIIFAGEDISALSADQRFHKGILRTFQIAHEFPTLSVLENLMMVPSNQLGECLSNTWFKRKAIAVEEKNNQEKAEEVLDFLQISSLKNEKAGNLSGGQKKLLELARTMMVDAKVVLLDEVGAGVNRTLLKQIGTAILKLNEDKGYTFCMIEHNMEFISRMCNPVVVLAKGKILTVGTATEIKNNEAVIDVYMGKGPYQK
ncbi:Branched-chain amino acid transport ATP-binding protein LivG (TC 3.A.1.4.1) [Bathymodiolus heckerae thiotrophic gill symbiont]|uniref:ABC transporter ATP-binding protein n=1 Tax=Bathymodiolus heckerae thiotrophic gill symbiont TaxID=1052212 RepID=UPI0010B696A9|nr:ABC transporter ATP-binding protein [Bathymodiolus heckerae thiotrophic gill symbiont]SMN12920.1 Branched-chain amino acid transport ATP-binding protein LivG (TC 3.A.1.4.1) [Bathymodiolus heckerae thiotrophic gill symbiont]SMN14450.1 Branched-chain amino acid transport ATP-binding protein LivG (TC 3.A.1.4.1) [uncultured Candidatus Thioglobus sp.]